MSPAPALTRGKGNSGRRYVWPPGTPKPDLNVPSVTTILDQMSKKALQYWAAKEVATYAVTHIDSWEGLPEDDAIDLLKRSPYRKTKKKGDFGTAIHEIVDSWMRVRLGDEPPELDDIDHLPYVAGVVRYLNDHVHRVLRSEFTVFNETFQYAGTADALVKLKDGRIVVVDWKTSNSIWPEYALQLVAYMRGDFIGTPEGQEVTLPRIDGGHIVHLPGDSTYAAYEIENSDRIFRTFTALRTIQLWREDYEEDVLGVPLVPDQFTPEAVAASEEE